MDLTGGTTWITPSLPGEIVQELRAAKTERRFLFATHNANIPVFGGSWSGLRGVRLPGSTPEMSLDARGSD